MLEIQAHLTRDPYDKDPFHKKQQRAVNSGEVRKPLDSPNHPLFNGSVGLSNLCLELACISPAHYKVHIEELERHRVALESFPLAKDNCTVVGTPHQITDYPRAECGKNPKTRPRRLSALKRLKRILGRRRSTGQLSIDQCSC